MDSELKQHSADLIGKKRYRLFDEVHDPIGKRKLTVHPDILFVMKAELPSGKDLKRLFLVEVDKGTEGLRVIADKLTAYHLYRREGIFKKFGAFNEFKVLFQTTSMKRAQNLAKIAHDFGDVLDIWVTDQNQVAPSSVLKEAIWLRPENDQPQALLK